ncbi:L,D-transpeptidase, partial [Planctomycetota bacterium]
PGQESQDDLVLTRILWLRGLEPGKNLGGEVDTWSRYIYLHGTNHVQSLGRPTSHGCVRLDPEEVINLFDRVEKNTRVLITGSPSALHK